MMVPDLAEGRRPYRATQPAAAEVNAKLSVQNLDAWYGATHVVKKVSMAIPARQITAVIGPSGCGKSTFVRCLNRMHECIPGARMDGRVLLDTELFLSSLPTPLVPIVRRFLLDFAQVRV